MSMFPNSTTWSGASERDLAREKVLFRFFNGVYAWMFVGLGITALVGVLISRSDAAMSMIYGHGSFVVLAMVLGTVVVAQAAQKVALDVNATLGMVLFLLYAALIGAMTSYIYRVYPQATIGSAFLVTAGTFAVMSLIGMVTKIDLTRIGGILTMAFIGIFLASLVNIFLRSEPLSWLITYAVVVIFVGLTAYYTQNLKVMALANAENGVMLGRLQVIGSLMLYVAFINLFFSILRIMGSRR